MDKRPVEIPEDCGRIERVVKSCRCRSSGPVTSSLLCECGDGSKLVVKDYTKKSLKWLVTIPYSIVYRYTFSPTNRMENEIHWLSTIYGSFKVPKVLAYCRNPKPRVLREFIDGTPVIKTRDKAAWEALGYGLALLHSRLGVALGDPNPGNFVYSGNDIWLVDMEQASPAIPEKAAWDILVLASTSIVLSPLLDFSLVETSLESYRKHVGDEFWRNVKTALASPPIMLLNPLLVFPYYNIRLIRFLRRL